LGKEQVIEVREGNDQWNQPGPLKILLT
jgi:hypothetical protein